MREVVLGDKPAVIDGWACCRFLFLYLLSIRNIFKTASPTPLQVSHRPGGFIPLEKGQWDALYNPLPAINYCKVTTKSDWIWRGCSFTAVGEHLSQLLAVPRKENPLIPGQLPRWQRPSFSTSSDGNSQLPQNFKAGNLQCFVSTPAEKAIWVICDDIQNAFWNEQSFLTKIRGGGSCHETHEKSTSKHSECKLQNLQNGSCDALSSAQSFNCDYHQMCHTVSHSIGKRLDKHQFPYCRNTYHAWFAVGNLMLQSLSNCVHNERLGQGTVSDLHHPNVAITG